MRSCNFLTTAHCGLIPNDFHWCYTGKETILGQSLLKYLQVLFIKDIFGFCRQKNLFETGLAVVELHNCSALKEQNKLREAIFLCKLSNRRNHLSLNHCLGDFQRNQLKMNLVSLQTLSWELQWHLKASKSSVGKTRSEWKPRETCWGLVFWFRLQMSHWEDVLLQRKILRLRF